MRIAITDAGTGAVLNIIEATSLERARMFYPSCRLATDADAIESRPYPMPPDTSASDLAALAVLVAAGGSLATPMLVAKTNQVYTRTSANAGADNIPQPVYSFLIPGGSLGPNGTLHYEAELTYTNSASAKQFSLYIGRTPINPGPPLPANTAATKYRGAFHNMAAAVNKFRGSMIEQGGSTVGFTATAIDTSIDQTVDVKVNWAGPISGEAISLQSLRAWVEYGA